MSQENETTKTIGVLKLSNAANISAIALKNVQHFRHFFAGDPMFDAIENAKEAIANLQNLCAEQERQLKAVAPNSEDDYEG